MASPFPLELVTPEGRLFAGSVRGVRLPGTGGSFGILARHAPLVGGLEIGVLEVTLEGGESQRYAVGEGFVEVAGGAVRVLTDFADASGRIDVARAREAERRAAERLKSRAENVDRARAEAALRRALMRLRVATVREV